MAAIDRRTWDLMKAEFILRAGRVNDTPYGAAAGRAEHFLTAAYLWIAKATHHHELEATETSLVFSTSHNRVDISTIYPCIVQAVELQDASTAAFITMLQPAHLREVAGRYIATAGEPKYFAQHGTDLFADRLPDVVYKSRIYYLNVEPTAPDFGAAAESPATGWAWDDPILELALVLAHTAVGRHDVAAAHSQIYQLFGGEMPQPRTIADTQRPKREEPQSNAALGGAHG